MIRELRKQLDEKKLSARELADSYYDRIFQIDPEIKSYLTLCPELAKQQAEEAQRRIDTKNASPLCGIPISIKDNICTKGIKTTCASRMLSDFVPVYDAHAAEQLYQDGAVLLGKTNMDEFAMGGSGQTSYFGGSRNPYDTTCVTGGSSSGAAASVAAGLCVAAIGSDTGGSVRQPAAFCGVTGLKPTYGTVSRYGLIAFASSLDQIGVLAKSAEDCGIVLNSIAGADPNDATSSKKTHTDYTQKIGSSLTGLKIGLPKEFFGDGIDPVVRESVLSAAEYYRASGCELLEVSMPSLPYAVSAYYLLSSAEAASNLSRFDGIKYGHRAEYGEDFNDLISRSRSEGFGMEVKRRIMLGNYALSSGYYDAYYKNALKIRQKIRTEYSEIFSQCDLILTPTAPTAAYKIGAQEEDPVKMYLADICTVPVNIAGLPAISTTCAYTEAGLPIGMSLVGKAFDEETILMAADRFERDFQRQEAAL